MSIRGAGGQCAQTLTPPPLYDATQQVVYSFLCLLLSERPLSGAGLQHRMLVVEAVVKEAKLLFSVINFVSSHARETKFLFGLHAVNKVFML